MYCVRPLCETDRDDLLRIAHESGPGFTSLPNDADYLTDKIQQSMASFSHIASSPGHQHYLFVLEDLAQKTVVGLCGIKALAGFHSPLYHFHLRTDIQHSRGLNVKRKHDVMHLSTDYSVYSEVGSLYLQPQSRQRFLGRLLAQCRYLFMCEYPQRFTQRVIAQMRGYCDDSEQSPFWHWMRHRFFDCDFAEADTLTGKGEKQFITELAPRYPLYIAHLPDAAQTVIGQVHKGTVPARKMLEKEGFGFHGYIDILDAGPSLQATLAEIKSVRNSAQLPCRIVATIDDTNPTHTITNTRLDAFKATMGCVGIDVNRGTAQISSQLAAILQVEEGEPVRFSPFH